VRRRPPVPAPVVRALVRTAVRPVLSPRIPVAAQRRWLELVTRATPLADDVALGCELLGGRHAEVAAPAAGPDDRAVLYLHGGGFAVGSPATHRALATHLAAASGATVHVLDYRLAPEHPFPAALDDALAAWRQLLDRGADPARTAIAGDSAGGWLALATALRLRDKGDPLPAVLGLISPWLDLAREVPDGDAMLAPSWLRWCAAGFAAGGDPSGEPFAPLAADLTGLPPLVVHVGGAEVLLDDAVRLARRARAAGVPVDLRRLDGLWHVVHSSAGLVRDSTAATRSLGAALAARLSG
jgi:epsilon-lactone hydrolase